MRAGLVNYLLAYSALVECGVGSEASLLGGQRLVLTNNTTAALWSGGGGRGGGGGGGGEAQMGRKRWNGKVDERVRGLYGLVAMAMVHWNTDPHLLCFWLHSSKGLGR